MSGFRIGRRRVRTGGLRRIRRGRLTLVEPLARLLPNPSALDERLNQSRKLENGAGFVIRKTRRPVAGHVSEHIEAGDVRCAKCRALRSPKGRAGDGVDLFNREIARFEDAKHLNHAE